MAKGRRKGIYSYQQLREAIDAGHIFSSGDPIAEGQIQPASMDLRLGDKAYRLISSFLPEKNQGVRELHMYDQDMVLYEHDLTDGMVLEKNCVYLIPLMEELRLPRNVRGRVNPKSTTGRLDIFARVLTDYNTRFDDIAPRYKGQLFIEVMPRSFTVKVKKGLSLVQLRLMTDICTVSDTRLKALHEGSTLLYSGDEGLERPRHQEANISRGLFMSVDLRGSGRDGIVGYKSKKNSHLIDLTKKDHYNIGDFWEPIERSDKGVLILEPEEFYILSSKERVRVPPMYAAEMVAYEAGSGELRTHYAGFFDPGFGFGPDGAVRGTKAVLEVRAHDVPFMVTHGQPFCKLIFEHMMELPEKVYGPKIGSSYQFQGVTLSKQFKAPGK